MCPRLLNRGTWRPAEENPVRWIFQKKMPGKTCGLSGKVHALGVFMDILAKRMSP